jgi:glycosyltransferase involved in cell wall biosynthesis
MSKISIIITTYNSNKQWFKECLFSAYDQNVDKEIIVLDDNSDEEYEEYYHELCTTLNKPDHPVKYFTFGTNIKPAGNFNRARDKVTGEYIMFLNSDDRLMPGILNTLMKSLDKDEKNALIYGSAVVMSNKGNIGDTQIACDLEQLFYRNPIPFCSAVIRKTVMDEIDWFDTTYVRSPDYELFTRMFMWLEEKKYKYMKLNDVPVYALRKHDKQITQTNSEEQNYYFRKAQAKLMAMYGTAINNWLKENEGKYGERKNID